MPSLAVPDLGSTSTSFGQLTSYTDWEYQLLLYVIVIAGLALFASFVYSLVTRSEVSKRWRTAPVTSALICGVAFIAYVVIALELVLGFRTVGMLHIPKPGTTLTGLRYLDWSVTVPLLTVEFLSVCNLRRATSAYLRFTTMGAAFLMILTGYFGVIGVGQSHATKGGLLIWGAVSTVFFLYLYVALLAQMRATVKDVAPETAVSLRNSAILLLSLWGVYPLVYLIPLFAAPGNAGWALTVQIAFSLADIAAKAGFGAQIHKVAKLRTAEDAASRSGSLPEFYSSEVYISGELIAEPLDGFPVTAGGRATGTRAASD
jgi:bacteriorhodopsin